MSRPPSSYEYEERRNARIRQLREQREGPVRRRRRVQPLLLVAWIAGTIALLVAAIIIGFNVFFAPRVMAWVEENPGAIEHGLVQDFVRWYQPEVLTDEPAPSEQRRVTGDDRGRRNRDLHRAAAGRAGTDLQPDRVPVRDHQCRAARARSLPARSTCRRRCGRRRSWRRCRTRGSARSRRSRSSEGPAPGGGGCDLRGERDDDEHGGVRRHPAGARRRTSSTSSSSSPTFRRVARSRATSRPIRTSSRSAGSMRRRPSSSAASLPSSGTT